MTKNAMNLLYYGDNLDVMRRHIEDKTIDIVYLDPPFNSNTNYNVLFAEKDGSKAASQIQAFSDTWTWNQESESVFAEIVTAGGKVSDCLQAFRIFLGECDMLAYLVMMAPRLVELRRVMKPTGSIYLHCDPTASHYLKMLMDAIFRPENFQNEIIWKRTSSHNDTMRWAHIHDTILFYAAQGFTWNPVYLAHDPEYVENFYRFTDKRGRYRLDHIIRTASMGPRPNLSYEYKGYKPEWGWRMLRDKIEALDRDERITWSKMGALTLKIPSRTRRNSHIFNHHRRSSAFRRCCRTPRVSNPKPVALLERIIKASSNPETLFLTPSVAAGPQYLPRKPRPHMDRDRYYTPCN